MIDSVSFCIINSDGKENDTLRCVESIRSQRHKHEDIFLLGDTVKMDNVKVLDDSDRPANGEVNAVRNYMAGFSSKEYIVFLDAAIELKDDWFDNLKQVDCFDVIGSRLVDSDGGRLLDWAYKAPLGELNLRLPLMYDEWTTKAYVNGNLIAIRRSLFDRIKFDENISDDGDSDFCIRASDLGYRLGVNPKAVATYHGTKSHNDAESHLYFEESQRLINEYRSNLAKGNKAFAENNHSVAIEYFCRVENDAPPEASVSGNLGWALYHEGRYDEATKVFEKYIGSNPHNDYCLRGLGWTKLQLGLYSESVSCLTKAIENIDIDDMQARIETSRGLGWAHYRKGDRKEAITVFTAALAIPASDEPGVLNDVYNGLGWAHLGQEEFDESIKYFELLLKHLDLANKEEIRLAKRGLGFARNKTVNHSFASGAPLPKILSLVSNRKMLIRRVASKIKFEFKKLFG